jgi:hypothetical protein
MEYANEIFRAVCHRLDLTDLGRVSNEFNDTFTRLMIMTASGNAAGRGDGSLALSYLTYATTTPLDGVIHAPVDGHAHCDTPSAGALHVSLMIVDWQCEDVLIMPGEYFDIFEQLPEGVYEYISTQLARASSYVYPNIDFATRCLRAWHGSRPTMFRDYGEIDIPYAEEWTGRFNNHVASVLAAVKFAVIRSVAYMMGGESIRGPPLQDTVDMIVRALFSNIPQRGTELCADFIGIMSEGRRFVDEISHNGSMPAEIAFRASCLLFGDASDWTPHFSCEELRRWVSCMLKSLTDVFASPPPLRPQQLLVFRTLWHNRERHVNWFMKHMLALRDLRTHVNTVMEEDGSPAVAIIIDWIDYSIRAIEEWGHERRYCPLEKQVMPFSHTIDSTEEAYTLLYTCVNNIITSLGASIIGGLLKYSD